MGKSGVLQSMGFQRVRYDWATEQRTIITHILDIRKSRPRKAMHLTKIPTQASINMQIWTQEDLTSKPMFFLTDNTVPSLRPAQPNCSIRVKNRLGECVHCVFSFFRIFSKTRISIFGLILDNAWDSRAASVCVCLVTLPRSATWSQAPGNRTVCLAR